MCGRNPTQKSIERSIFELVICVKQALKIHNQILEARVTSARCAAHACFSQTKKFRRNGFRLAVDCKLQMRSKRLPGMPLSRWRSFQGFKEIGEKARAFQIANERGQLGHLQRELVASLWPENASITCVLKRDTLVLGD